MEIGTIFKFNSNGRKMKALFLERNEDKIKCVVYQDKLAGINIEIDKSQIIK